MPRNPSLDALLARERIDAFPDWPADLGQALTEIDPGLFATEPIEASPWDLAGWRTQLLNRETDLALCGFAGYGVQSFAFHLFVRSGPLVLMVQTAWVAYESPEAQADSASGAISLANTVIALAQQVRSLGRWPAEQTMLIVDSDFAQSGWAWIRSHETEAAPALRGSTLGAINALDALAGPSP